MERLADLEVLFLDCQATGPASRDGDLLEIGWCRASAAGASHATVTARLVALPPARRIPPRVMELTGLRRSDLAGAPEPVLAWDEIASQAGRCAHGPLPTAIHYARFEEPFLRRLHDARGGDFPLDIVCVHRLARGLLPELPRRTLRALTGYFGRPVGKLRRSAEHVAATAFVWRELVDLLRQRERIDTWRDLRAWLEVPAPSTRRIYPMPRAARLALPDAPGVYRMHRIDGTVLYVGKATSLHRRVNGYFQKQARVAERTLEMLTQARELSFVRTGSALEAALFEADEIKRASPPYNVALAEGERRLFFATRDLARWSDHADEACCVGPLASRDPISALPLLTRALRHGDAMVGRRAAAEILSVPPSWAPEPRCFAEGLALFVATHPEVLPGGTRALVKLGTAVWRNRPLEAARADDDERPARPGEPRWDPQTVARQIEEIVARAAHTLRRSRWFCTLGESALRWQEGVGPARILVLDRGRIAEVRDAGDGERAPVPPGFSRARPERQRDFTVASFDRLRVLTTELRRVSGPLVELRLGPSATLGAQRLQRVLQWV